jgi:hypothetical protein
LRQFLLPNRADAMQSPLDGPFNAAQFRSNFRVGKAIDLQLGYGS